MKKKLIGLSAMLLLAGSVMAQKNLSYIKMTRSPCFGRCPVYSVEIYKNGLVRFSGHMFTEHQGVYEKNIGKAKAARLLKDYGSYRLDTCQKEYTRMVADLPGIYYMFTYGKTTKKINHADFGPEMLKELATRIDSVGNVNSSWRKVADTATIKY